MPVGPFHPEKYRGCPLATPRARNVAAALRLPSCAMNSAACTVAVPGVCSGGGAGSGNPVVLELIWHPLMQSARGWMSGRRR